MRLLVGHGPLQGTGRVVEEVDTQLQVGLPRGQRRAEQGQLQPLSGFPAYRRLQHTGVEAAERDGGRDHVQWDWGGQDTSPSATRLPPHQGPLWGPPERKGEHSRPCREELGWRGWLEGRNVSHVSDCHCVSVGKVKAELRATMHGPALVMGGKETGRQRI